MTITCVGSSISTITEFYRFLMFLENMKVYLLFKGDSMHLDSRKIFDGYKFKCQNKWFCVVNDVCKFVNFLTTSPMKLSGLTLKYLY